MIAVNNDENPAQMRIRLPLAAGKIVEALSGGAGTGLGRRAGGTFAGGWLRHLHLYRIIISRDEKAEGTPGKI